MLKYMMSLTFIAKKKPSVHTEVPAEHMCKQHCQVPLVWCLEGLFCCISHVSDVFSKFSTY